MSKSTDVLGPDVAAPGSRAADPAPGARHGRRWLVLGVIAIAQLMVVLDATIVNIALPSAQHALGFSNGDRQWIVTAYALAFGSLLLLGGRLPTSSVARRPSWSASPGSPPPPPSAASPPTSRVLFSARALQGLFGALLAPAALALLTTTFTDPRERAQAFGIYGAIAGGGGAIGLLLGGILTAYLSGAGRLYVNLVFAVVAVAGGLPSAHQRSARQPAPARHPRRDAGHDRAVRPRLWLLPRRDRVGWATRP